MSDFSSMPDLVHEAVVAAIRNRGLFEDHMPGLLDEMTDYVRRLFKRAAETPYTADDNKLIMRVALIAFVHAVLVRVAVNADDGYDISPVADACSELAACCAGLTVQDAERALALVTSEYGG